MLCTAAGIVAGLMAALATGHVRLALQVGLEFWMAAGLLRLTGAPSLTGIATAAAILGVRQLVGLGLRSTPVDSVLGRRSASTEG